MNGEQSYINPSLERRARPEAGGFGLFAREPISAGAVLVAWGGEVVTGAVLLTLPEEDRRYSVQIDDDLFMAGGGGPDEADFVNHSCDPNAGIRGQVTLVAVRAIEPGEEITYDYAMTDSSPYDEFECRCGAPICRGRITGGDWLSPDLQRRYRGFFSTYLARRMSDGP